MSGQYRRWIFTVNNYTEEDCKCVEDMECRYVICGKEDQGTPHLQGYVEFDGPKRLKGVAALLPRARLEGAKGNAKANEAYCSKENLWHERGTPAKPGTRNDLIAVREGLREGTSLTAMLDEGVIASSSALKFAEAAAKYLEKERDWQTLVIWIYGPSGSGKSRRARELLGDRVYCKSGSNSKWWEGYDGHEDVVIDDFRDSSWPLLDLLAVTDRYGHRVECKGGSRQLLARRIVITSIDHPREYYKEAKREPMKQVYRRLTDCYRVETPPVTVSVTEVGGNNKD